MGTPTQATSKRLFNSRHRIDIADAIRRSDGLVDGDVICRMSGSPKSTVYVELQVLAELGLLRRFEPVGRERLVHYVVTDSEHPFWTLAGRLVSDNVQDHAVDVHESPVPEGLSP